MRIIFLSNLTSKQKVSEECAQILKHDIDFFTLNDSDEKIISSGDCDVIVADAMAVVSDRLISSMPSLKLIQSEGVGYQGFDLESARRHGVAVCNNKGINDTAVSEHTVMLMLAVLKNLVVCNNAVLNGKQIETKKIMFGRVKELSECTVGLIGFGDIAKCTAVLLKNFGCKVLYSNRTRFENDEEKYGVIWSSREELLKKSDIVSLHIASNKDTDKMADKEFFANMKNGSYFINTSRGELVDNNALFEALVSGKLSGAGLDVISPEPVTKDNILLDIRVKEKIIFTPHIAGITSFTVKKLFSQIEENILLVEKGKKPKNLIIK